MSSNKLCCQVCKVCLVRTSYDIEGRYDVCDAHGQLVPDQGKVMQPLSLVRVQRIIALSVPSTSSTATNEVRMRHKNTVGRPKNDNVTSPHCESGDKKDTLILRHHHSERNKKCATS